jgi:hypothetical protein
MAGPNDGRRGYTWQVKDRPAILERDGHICWWCNHPGAMAVDHLRDMSKGGHPRDPGNLAAIHGREKCPVCHRCCNTDKRNGLPRPTVREWNW